MSSRKISRQQKESEKQDAIAQAQAEFFGGITKEEALQVFKTLAVLAQFRESKSPRTS